MPIFFKPLSKKGKDMLVGIALGSSIGSMITLGVQYYKQDSISLEGAFKWHDNPAYDFGGKFLVGVLLGLCLVRVAYHLKDDDPERWLSKKFS